MDILRAVFVVLLLSSCLRAAGPTTKPVYDAMGFANKPDLGLKKIRLVSPPPEREDWIRLHAREAVKNGQILCFDIEHLPVDLRLATDCEVEVSMATLGRMVDQAHDEAPVRVGFYALMPTRDYWSPVQYLYATDPKADPWWTNNRAKFTAQHKLWQKTNARFRFGRDAGGRFTAVGLADRVDVLFPSLYTFYKDQAAWDRYAQGNLDEARKYSKKVYPFLWMQYHNSTVNGWQLLEPEYFAHQVAWCLEHADGVVLWGAYEPDGKPLLWDEKAPWWVATKKVLIEKGVLKP